MRAGFYAMPFMLAGLALSFMWHISVGAKPVPLHTVFDALTAYDSTIFEHVIIFNLRFPRAVIAAFAGASLAVSGALMQGVTRNPLAEPGILGLLVGASFAVVMAVGVFHIAGSAWIPLIAAAGALVAALIVWGFAAAAPGGSTPLTLILSGAALTAFLGAFITLANLLDDQSFENLRVWLTGSLAGRDLSVFFWSMPWMIGGLLLAFGVARQVTALAMGDDTAAGLGVDVARLKALAMISVIALTAAAVSIAGPMGFIGLVIPHVVRLFFGADYRLIVPYSAVMGATYLLIVDIAARLVLAPTELSAGIVTSMLGAPFFVWLVRARL